MKVVMSESKLIVIRLDIKSSNAQASVAIEVDKCEMIRFTSWGLQSKHIFSKETFPERSLLT